MLRGAPPGRAPSTSRPSEAAPSPSSSQTSRSATPHLNALADARVPTSTALAAVAAGVSTPAPASSPAPVTAAPRTAAELIAAATYEYHTTGRARAISLNPGIAYPYGVGDPPVIRCAVLRVCVVELEPGEELTNEPLRGDRVRWIVDTARSGAEGGTRLVSIKPKSCNLSANLTLPTDRRVYYLALESPPCDRRSDNPRGAYDSRVRFYYPAEAPALSDAAATRAASLPGTAPAVGDDGAVNPPARLARRATWAGGAGGREWEASATGPAVGGITVDVTRLQFDYTVRRDKRFPWAPAQLFDDGSHVFIKVPPEADAYAAPALFELDDGDRKALLNYVVRDGFYVTDRTFRRAAFVLGQGKAEQRVVLENRAFGRGAERPASGASNGAPR